MKVITKNFKNNKFLYYFRGFILLLLPKFFYKTKLSNILFSIPNDKLEYILSRVNYYNKIDKEIEIKNNFPKLSDLKIKKKGKTYFFDAYSVSKYFPQSFRAKFLFGDVDFVPNDPSFVKSRPINSKNENSIILKLNKVRHFLFVKDSIPIEKKKNILFGRAAVHQKQRIDFYNKYFNNKFCDLGQINRGTDHDNWFRKKVSIDYHLKHKFILCIEGNDVASNLKWVMSSNSVAVMPKPKFESWFMEGKLIPDHHYIQIKEDYSDLQEKLSYYIKYPKKLIQISSNANNYVNQFKDVNDEKIISLLVMEKFFKLTNQKKSLINFFS